MSEKFEGKSRKQFRKLSALRKRNEKEKARIHAVEFLLGVNFFAPILIVGLDEESMRSAPVIWLSLLPLGCAYVYFYYKAGLTELEIAEIELAHKSLTPESETAREPSSVAAE